MQLRAAFEAAPVPEDLAGSIVAAWHRLGGQAVAVRSSATTEDLPGASSAGQQDTLLDVTVAEQVVDAVRRCWSSLWTARALAYRTRQGTPHAEAAVAVVVQRMVPAEVAGVLFTADPLTGRRDRVVVEAVRGLGDALVSGRVTPQRWVLDAGTRAVLNESDGPDGPLLDAERLRDLAGLGLAAATLSGAPQDVEWATASGRCWLLQSRPITTLFPLPPGPPAGPGLRVHIPLTLASQGIAEPLTPAGTAVFAGLATAVSSLWSLRSRPRRELPPWVSLAAGRLFYDITPLLASPRLGRRLADRMALKDPATSAALREWLDREGDRLDRARGMVLPVGLSVWVAREVPGLLAATVAPDRARRRLLARADDQVQRVRQEAAGLAGPREQVNFVLENLPRRTFDVAWSQLPPLYVGLISGALAAWLCERWLGSATGLEPVRRWLPSDPTLAMGAALARLAQTCREAGVEPSPTAPGTAEFLAAFGHRAPDREIDLGLPRFRDDPSYVVQLVRGYLAAGDPAELLARHQRGAEQAEAAVRDLVAAARRARGRLPALVLRAVLVRYRALGGLRERPKFDLVRVLALGRGLLQQVGVALVAAGRLDGADDVFFLDPADLRAGVEGTAPDLRERADRGRREYERELGRRAVPLVLTSDGETVYAPAAPAQSAPGTLVGTGVSPGVHEGVVQVLDSPVGATLAPGEVLVAASTDPGWTPLFHLAGALVMEVGGVVSHGAIVAREYGIPAVATVPDATRRLRTGQRVRVDGGAGTITLLDDS
ncbi:pyruvate, water dikinase [Geodermatophilus obscurus]|uniref:Pyruvate, water dikinase n=1 Tax=Geodermatophilus obscurus TaxID=1861 RepID=A0A1M7UXT6_9ACTN|nr:PEP/pyruvate-binding domain-containing protein [Geodermatophilus obscurus]SHN87775.1 pyruvate, water dikinase [Geodermatophilus obscurus]